MCPRPEELIKNDPLNTFDAFIMDHEVLHPLPSLSDALSLDAAREKKAEAAPPDPVSEGMQ